MKLEFHPSGERLLGVAGSVRHSLAEDLLFCHKDSVIDGGRGFWHVICSYPNACIPDRMGGMASETLIYNPDKL